VHVDLTEGMLEAHLGMPGVRPAETRLLLLPDWHYQVPFARAALTDANVSIFLSVLCSLWHYQVIAASASRVCCYFEIAALYLATTLHVTFSVCYTRDDAGDTTNKHVHHTEMFARRRAPRGDPAHPIPPQSSPVSEGALHQHDC
jgi:hypothetical protein